MPHQDKHPEQIDPTWPADTAGDSSVNEFLADHQGAKSPFGDDISLPVALERHGRHYTPRAPGSERRDTDFGGDESI